MNGEPIRIETAVAVAAPRDAVRALRRAGAVRRPRLPYALATGAAIVTALLSGLAAGLTVYFGSALIAMVLTGVLALTAVPLVSAVTRPPRRGYVR